MIAEETLNRLERDMYHSKPSEVRDTVRLLIIEIRNLKSTIDGINSEWDFQNSLVDRRLNQQEEEIKSLKAQLEEKNK